MLNIFLGWVFNGYVLKREILSPTGLVFFEPFYNVEGIEYAIYDLTPHEFEYCKNNLLLYYRRRDPIEVLLWLWYNTIPQKKLKGN